MRQRIRTIKPEFFSHEILFDAERETGLPLRLAFIGLWTCCDREGRFEWRPRPLKTHIMPYDEVDFSRVLDALATRGFVVKYVSNSREYGSIPSWRRHQVVNNKEAASEIPESGEVVEINENSTRESRVDYAIQSRSSGRELEGKGTGKELEGKNSRSIDLLSSVDDAPDQSQLAFDAYNEMAKRAGLPVASKLDQKRKSAIKARLKDAKGIEGWMIALSKVEASPHCTGSNDRGWKADLDFVCTESKFVKIMEGSYDQQSNRNRNTTRGTYTEGDGRPRGLVGAAMRILAEEGGRSEGRGAASEWGQDSGGLPHKMGDKGFDIF